MSYGLKLVLIGMALLALANISDCGEGCTCYSDGGVRTHVEGQLLECMRTCRQLAT